MKPDKANLRSDLRSSCSQTEYLKVYQGYKIVPMFLCFSIAPLIQALLNLKKRIVEKERIVEVYLRPKILKPSFVNILYFQVVEK
jgi:hypothetical protein